MREADQPGRLICERAANALVQGVRLRPWASWLMGWNDFGATKAFLRAMDRRQSGLWVGGTLSVHDGGVRFKPNGFNRAIQEGQLASELSWPEVLGIQVRHGVLTNIIELSHAHGKQAYRCFSATRVAADMNDAWRAATCSGV